MGYGFIDSSQKVGPCLDPGQSSGSNGWCIRSLNPAKAWVVLSTNTDTTLDKGDRPTNSPYTKAMEQETEGGLSEEKMHAF